MAPILFLPRVFEPELCRKLIQYYEGIGGTPSGFMRQQDGKTVGILDPKFKRRRDVNITDQNLIQAARLRVSRRLVPEIWRAFQFRVTRIERDIVACYDADGTPVADHRLAFEFLPPHRSPAKLKIRASVETALGVFINDTLPEDSAALLRAAAVAPDADARRTIPHLSLATPAAFPAAG